MFTSATSTSTTRRLVSLKGTSRNLEIAGRFCLSLEDERANGGVRFKRATRPGQEKINLARI